MIVVPEPSPDAVGYNDPISQRLDPGQQLTVEFAPTQQVAEFMLPVLAISKHPESSYEVWMDDERVYGPSPIPPTDIDDIAATFVPAKSFSSSMTIYVRNLSDTTTRRYSIQPVGWEVADAS